MKKVRKGTPRHFVQQFVLGFGFLSGLWVKLGFDPEDILIGFVSDFFEMVSPGNTLSPLFWVVPIVLTVVSLAGAFYYGEFVGVLAVGLSFVAGFLFPDLLFVFLLVSAVVVGIFAVRVKKKKLF